MISRGRGLSSLVCVGHNKSPDAWVHIQNLKHCIAVVPRPRSVENAFSKSGNHNLESHIELLLQHLLHVLALESEECLVFHCQLLLARHSLHLRQIEVVRACPLPSV